MIDAVLDTDVLVETLRGRAEAGDWLRSVDSQHETHGPINTSIVGQLESLELLAWL